MSGPGLGLDLNKILMDRLTTPFTGRPFNKDASASSDTQGPPEPGSTAPKPGETRETQLPSGRRVLQTYSPTGQMSLSGDPEYAWVTEGSYFDPKDPNGTSGEGAAGRHLQAATAALSAYLQAQSLADARKQSASDTFQQMASFAVPAGTSIMPGYEQNGPMQALAAIRGRKSFTPRALQTAHVNPAELQNPGQVPPEVAAMIANVRGAA